MCICLSPFSSEEIEAQKRPRTPELGFAPRPAHPHTRACPCHPARPSASAGSRGLRPHQQRVPYPGSQLPRQTQSQAAPMCGPPSKFMALGADGKLIREVTVALEGGRCQQPWHLHQHGPVRHTAWAGGQACKGPPSPFLLRSFSCHHNALKTSGPTLGPVCNSP